MTTPDPIEELEALLNQAEPMLPLRTDGYRFYVGGGQPFGEFKHDDVLVPDALIVAAVNALPDLLQRLREAEAEREELRAGLKRAIELPEDFEATDSELLSLAAESRRTECGHVAGDRDEDYECRVCAQLSAAEADKARLDWLDARSCMSFGLVQAIEGLGARAGIDAIRAAAPKGGQGE